MPAYMGCRAFQVEWHSDVWLIASDSQNQAKCDAVRLLKESHPGKTIHYYPDVAVRRWPVYDAWAQQDETGWLWTRDEVEDWLKAREAAQPTGGQQP
jgi:hypothetical protein